MERMASPHYIQPGTGSAGAPLGLTQWEVDLCGCGDCNGCMYSWCCHSCAVAQAKSNLDGSYCCFNCCAYNSISLAAILRSSYGMEQNCCCDCMTAFFCPCCLVNQLYQTSIKYGPGGAIKGRHTNLTKNESSCGFGNCCMSCLCPICCLPSKIQASTGIPWCASCCCMTPLGQSQLLRYQYGIEGSDEVWECWVPCAAQTMFTIVLSIFGLSAYAGLLLTPYTAYFQGRVLDFINQKGEVLGNNYGH